MSKGCNRQDAEKARQLRSRLIEILNVPLRVRLQFRLVCGLADDLFERLAPPRQDASFPMLRSRIVQILTGNPAASLTRRRAQTWCSLFVAPCAPEGTLPVFTRCGLAERTF